MKPLEICVYAGLLLCFYNMTRCAFELWRQKRKVRQISVYVAGKQGNDYTVEFTLDNVSHRHTIRSQRALQQGSIVNVWIIDNDPTTIQLAKPPDHIVVDAFTYLLAINIVIFLIYIYLLVHKPQVACYLTLLIILFFILSFFF